MVYWVIILLFKSVLILENCILLGVVKNVLCNKCLWGDDYR